MGGVAGHLDTNSHMVARYNQGTVTGESEGYTGSLAGNCYGSNTCYDTETSNGKFVESVSNSPIFTTCYWLGDSSYCYSYGADYDGDECSAKSEEDLKSETTVRALKAAIDEWNSTYSEFCTCTYRLAVDASGGYPVLEQQ